MPGDPRLRRTGGKRPQISDALGQRWVHGKELVQRNKKAAFALMLIGKSLGRNNSMIARARRGGRGSSFANLSSVGRPWLDEGGGYGMTSSVALQALALAFRIRNLVFGMDDLFGGIEQRQPSVVANAPLAARMRPRTLDEYLGQQHILGPGKLLRRAIESDRLTSIILYGPPGTGKTSLAQVITATTHSHFERLSGVESSVADIRRVAGSASLRLKTNGTRTILFVDEIHRFNKAQQDVLLPDVENGVLRLIGATTHNPFFYVNSPLVSRSQVFQLEPLGVDDLVELMKRALADQERGLGNHRIQIDDEALHFLAEVSDGDARRCLNALEIAALTTEPDAHGVIQINRAVAGESIQKKPVVYDGDEDEHYDTISAFIKSMRGSDPDATLYWLAKMLYAGEDIRFIARRIVIAASEDVGMADSNALVVAVAAQQAVEFVGLPEAQIPLAHAAVYVATAPKSNRSLVGLSKAMADVKEGRVLAVPRHLRSTAYRASKALGHGTGYKYAHDYEGGYVPQAYLPEGRIYYEPSDNGAERRVKERLEYWRSKFEAGEFETPGAPGTSENAGN